jgi:MarR family transcriptional regulator, organic hydroperoxide resistance regulator
MMPPHMRLESPMPKTAAGPKVAVELDDFLCFAIYSAGHAFNRFYKPLLDGLGLTYPQYLVLTALWARDGQTVGSLGERLFLESNTLTPLIKRLEAMGYVTRSRDPADERQVRVRLTAEGSALRTKACDVPASVLQATGLSAGAVRELKAGVARVRDSLLSASAARDR